MTQSTVYGNDFYAGRDEQTRASADAVVAVLKEHLAPRSVVDLGCGVGTWLAAFMRSGAEEVLGLDGDYVNPQYLEIPRERFVPTDLSRPVQLGRQFDLAMSVEVAEHLPAPSAATFVRSLAGLAPVVLFSAAIPFQGGVNHVNEQWPDYWNDLFEAEGFVCIDFLRDALWNRKEILYWYRQNILLFVRRDALSGYPSLQALHERAGGAPRPLVHPEAYLLKCTAPPSLRGSAAGVLRAIGNLSTKIFASRSSGQ